MRMLSSLNSRSFWTPLGRGGCKILSNILSCNQALMSSPNRSKAISASPRALNISRAFSRSSATDCCQSRSEESASNAGASATKPSTSILVGSSDNPWMDVADDCQTFRFLWLRHRDVDFRWRGNANRPVLWKRLLLLVLGPSALVMEWIKWWHEIASLIAAKVPIVFRKTWACKHELSHLQSCRQMVNAQACSSTTHHSFDRPGFILDQETWYSFDRQRNLRHCSFTTYKIW